MQRFLILFYVFSSSFFCFSQTTFNGNLKTIDDESIYGIIVTIKELNTDSILNYSISNNEGKFSILVNTKSEKVQLNINSMGFKTIVKIIDNRTQTLNLILEEEITALNEVIIKSNPITRNGDTINYSVNAFSKQKDRTIADVLKNMPGIEILNNGKILYQGEPINKYYIGGLDLLEGKYNLANSNLPHKEVLRVQVLENHQPIKILDSLVFSRQAAINIELKNAYTFTGQADLGLGFPSLLWDVNVTPMLFTKKRQMLSSYQTNNVGDNVSSQLKTLTVENLLEQFYGNNLKQNWLAIQQIELPNFSEQRWLKNNIHLITTNYLQKIKKDFELRLNVSYVNDYQQQIGFTNTRFFTINDTISLFEKKNNELYNSMLETNLTLQNNTDKYYFKNSLVFQGFWDKERGTLQLNNENLNQNLNNRYFKLSNNLKTLFSLWKQIATLESYIDLNRTPQSLTINPGQYNDLLNSGNKFDEVIQNIKLNTFYVQNSLSFTKGWKTFSFSPKVGFQYEKQLLESDILISTNSNSNFENHLDWSRSNLYIHLKTQYSKDNLRLELITPLNFHNYQLEDNPLQRSQDLKRITFEPKFSLTYDLTNFWQLGTTAQLDNQFGTINQVYYNYILKSYRNIQRIDAPLPENRNLSHSAFLRYRNPIKAIFLNFIYSHTKTDNNLLYKNKILDNGAIELEAIEQDNERLSHNIMTSATKYFSHIKTNLTLSANYSLQNFQQILNTEVTHISDQNWRFNTKINIDLTDWLNTEIESIFQFSNSQIQIHENRTITQQFHKFNVNVYPNKNQYIGVETEYVKNNLFSNNTENIFTDLVYRYNWMKKNIDFELQLSNLFNTKEYSTININNFSYVETNIKLRQRQLLFKIRFSL